MCPAAFQLLPLRGPRRMRRGPNSRLPPPTRCEPGGSQLLLYKAARAPVVMCCIKGC